MALTSTGMGIYSGKGKVKNTLEILKQSNGQIQTTIITSDGVIVTEIHRYRLTDSDVLSLLLEKQFYQKFIGGWDIIIPSEQKLISHNNFSEAITEMQSYIYERDNIDYSV